MLNFGKLVTILELRWFIFAIYCLISLYLSDD